MQKLAILLGLGTLFFSQAALAQVSEEEIRALRAQIEVLTQRLDELERQSRPASPPPAQAGPFSSAPHRLWRACTPWNIPSRARTSKPLRADLILFDVEKPGAVRFDLPPSC